MAILFLLRYLALLRNRDWGLAIKIWRFMGLKAFNCHYIACVVIVWGEI